MSTLIDSSDREVQEALSKKVKMEEDWRLINKYLNARKGWVSRSVKELLVSEFFVLAMVFASHLLGLDNKEIFVVTGGAIIIISIVVTLIKKKKLKSARKCLVDNLKIAHE